MNKYLVVGNGLAGIAMTETLLQMRQQVVVMESPLMPSSTMVSTGMYNPVVFRRLNKSWMVDDLLPVMHDFYDRLHEKLGLRLKRSFPFYKRIPNDLYAEWWTKRKTEQGFEHYLGNIDQGSGEVFQAGLINCVALKKAYDHYLLSENLLIHEVFDHANIRFQDGKAEYGQELYDHIIFCEGVSAVNNPFFRWLPFNLCKGEWIIVETAHPVTDMVINNIVNIIPLGRNRYKLSSTYSWHDLDWATTTEAEHELTRAFETLFNSDYKVVERAAGLRPTVDDRRPLLGTHPDHPALHIFNGLGSKGVMLAPYFSRHFADHLVFGKPLLDEVNILRHFKKTLA